MADDRGGAGEAQLPHHTVRKLTYEEGGGYLVEFPDHPGCIADGETVGDAMFEAADAWRSYAETVQELARDEYKPRRTERHMP